MVTTALVIPLGLITVFQKIPEVGYPATGPELFQSSELSVTGRLWTTNGRVVSGPSVPEIALVGS